MKHYRKMDLGPFEFEVVTPREFLKTLWTLKMATLSIRIADHLKEKVAAIADQQGVSMNNFITSCLRNGPETTVDFVPCQLVWQETKFKRLLAAKLVHLPDEQAGVHATNIFLPSLSTAVAQETTRAFLTNRLKGVDLDKTDAAFDRIMSKTRPGHGLSMREVDETIRRSNAPEDLSR